MDVYQRLSEVSVGIDGILGGPDDRGAGMQSFQTQNGCPSAHILDGVLDFNNRDPAWYHRSAAPSIHSPLTLSKYEDGEASFAEQLASVTAGKEDIDVRRSERVVPIPTQPGPFAAGSIPTSGSQLIGSYHDSARNIFLEDDHGAPSPRPHHHPIISQPDLQRILEAGSDVDPYPKVTLAGLRDRYARLFGKTTTSNNRKWLVKRLVQAEMALKQYGTIPELLLEGMRGSHRYSTAAAGAGGGAGGGGVVPRGTSSLRPAHDDRERDASAGPVLRNMSMPTMSQAEDPPAPPLPQGAGAPEWPSFAAGAHRSPWASQPVPLHAHAHAPAPAHHRSASGPLGAPAPAHLRNSVSLSNLAQRDSSAPTGHRATMPPHFWDAPAHAHGGASHHHHHHHHHHDRAATDADLDFDAAFGPDSPLPLPSAEALGMHAEHAWAGAPAPDSARTTTTTAPLPASRGPSPRAAAAGSTGGPRGTSKRQPRPNPKYAAALAAGVVEDDGGGGAGAPARASPGRVGGDSRGTDSNASEGSEGTHEGSGGARHEITGGLAGLGIGAATGKRGASRSAAVVASGRKHHKPWTPEETQALVEGVAICGGGKWADIKKLNLRAIERRSAVDLKDKWRNLTRIALGPNNRGRTDKRKDLPAELLDRVRELAMVHAKRPTAGAVNSSPTPRSYATLPHSYMMQQRQR
ncbi:unnamed protein product [Pedinophyceae sp. YPF-701]|nr:unnamed protein product [Pedinophyceae sp. YPF-701]